MNHKTTCQTGTDPRNHTVTCKCGWAYSGTYLTIRKQAEVHAVCFMDEDRAWTDPRRKTEMPRERTHYA